MEFKMLLYQCTIGSNSFITHGENSTFARARAQRFARSFFNLSSAAVRLKTRPAENSPENLLQAQQVAVILGEPIPEIQLPTESNQQPSWSEFCSMFEEAFNAL